MTRRFPSKGFVGSGLSYLFSFFMLFTLLFILSLNVFPDTPKPGNKGDKNPGKAPGTGNSKQAIRGLIERADTGKDPRKALEHGEEALARLERLPPDYRLKGKVLNLIAGANARLGNYDAAEKYARALIELARESGFPGLMADGHRRLGNIAFSKGDYYRALGHFTKAAPVYRDLNRKKEVSSVSFYLGFCHWHTGDTAKAMELVLDTLTLAEASGDLDGMGNGYNGLGIIDFNLGNYKQALEYYQKALATWKKMGNDAKVAAVLNNIALVYYRTRQYDRSLFFFSQSLAIKEKLGMRAGIAITYNNMGEVQENENNLKQALDYYKRSYAIRREIGNRYRMSNNLLNLGRIKRKMKDYPGALRLVHKALRGSRENNEIRVIRDSCLELSEIYTRLGDDKKALAYYKEYIQVVDKFNNEEIHRKIRELEFRYESDKKEKEISLLEKSKEVDDMVLTRERNVKMSFVIISFLLFISIIALVIRNKYRAHITRELREAVERHRETARRHRAGEATYRALAERSVVGMCIVQEGEIIYINPRLLNIFGVDAQDAIGKSPLDFVHPQDLELMKEFLQMPPDGSVEGGRIQFRGLKRGGQTVHLEAYGGNFMYQGKPASLATIIDITGRKKAEENLLVGKKLEAAGMLAGGIGHDFNNLLSIIIGNIQMVLEDVGSNPAAFRRAEKIEQAAFDASDLVRELQAYSTGGS